MRKLFGSHSPLRIFAFSVLLTVVGIIWTGMTLGQAALLTVTILIVIEVVFSFDNAIVNAKILERLSQPWQIAFLTVGMVIAVFGMRLLFPLLIVSLAADISIAEVWTLALNDPERYSHILGSAHHQVAAFGGSFLLMLALDFFIRDKHAILWLKPVERYFRRFNYFWLPPAVTLAVLAVFAVLGNHTEQSLMAGLLGLGTYVLIQLATHFLATKQPKGKHLTGLAAFALFMYLQVIDASFSFDGVIGAFAITNQVILIAIGLGIGAYWVRSLTIYLVRKGTLGRYVYLEHGAFYTILFLSLILLGSMLVEVPDVLTGLLSVCIIGTATYSSLRYQKKNR